MAQEQRKKQKGSGSKSSKNPGAASRKAKRKKSHDRLEHKKAARVLKSSKGKWTLERMRKRNSDLLVIQRNRPSPRVRKTRDYTSLSAG